MIIIKKKHYHSDWTKVIFTPFIPVIFILIMAGIGLAQKHQPEPRGNSNKKTVIERNERIVHIELLSKKKKKFQPPLRNIFLPRWSRGTNLGLQKIAPARGEEGSAGAEESLQGEVSSNKTVTWNIFLEYIGYIKSQGRIVALILYQNQPWAVKVGDVLEDGSLISAISEDELEITGPNKEKKTFRLIEEKP
ncbi:hypothetical protein NLC35_02490 [Candidatus Aminicenantes bacterium AC-334-K16]|jgi:hypothetical protein|nr:hypothetical protein [Candidatus Aminicenantes bacterium AC-334-K16]